MSEEFIRQSQLIDQVVLDRATMDECGRIEVMWCYPKVHRVLGFICKAGSFDRKKLAFNLDQLDKVGENGVLVKSEPVETDRDRVKQLETLLGCEVWTDEGKRVGRIQDYVFQLNSGNIRYYLLAQAGVQGFTGKLYSLYPNQILGYGRGRVMVSAGIVPGLELYQVGLDQKLEQKFSGLEERIERKLKRVAERVNEGLNSETPGDLQAELQSGFQSGLQSLVQRAKSVSSEVGSRVKERAQDFLDEGLVDRIDARFDRRTNDMDDRDRDQYDDFDFEDWEEPQSVQTKSFDSNTPPNSYQSVAQRYSKRSPQVDVKSDLEDDEWSEPEVRTDRPPLNLSTERPNSSNQSAREFTAKPRPERDDRDPWEDDWV